MAQTLRLRGLNSTSYQGLLQVGLATAFVVPMLYLLVQGQWRIMVMLMCLAGLLLLWRVNRTLAICVNFAYLLLLGDIRRIVDMFAAPTGVDPLLVVGALFALCLFIPMLRRLRAQDSLSKVMLTLMCVMFLEVFNPKQGSLMVGVSAGLFYIVPVVWFWIGRAYATEALIKNLVFRVILPLGILASLLGLYQTYVGFFPWEQAWITTALANGYTALYIGGEIRAFGFSVNGVEFVMLMVVTAVIAIAAAFQRRYIYLPFLPPLAFGIFLGSSRTAILRVLIAVCAIWAIRGYSRRNRAKVLPRLAFAVVAGLGVLAYSASHAAQSEGAIGPNATTADLASSHVVQGLANPLDPTKSTAGAHAGMVGGGLLAGILNPVGSGLGAVTLGADKFGGGSVTTGSSEVDFSDAFISMGIVGGVCFLLMIFFTGKYLLAFFEHGSPEMRFILIGVFVCCTGSWIPQGQYALAPFVCLLMGFLTKQHLAHRDTGRLAVQES